MSATLEATLDKLSVWYDTNVHSYGNIEWTSEKVVGTFTLMWRGTMRRLDVEASRSRYGLAPDKPVPEWSDWRVYISRITPDEQVGPSTRANFAALVEPMLLNAIQYDPAYGEARRAELERKIRYELRENITRYGMERGKQLLHRYGGEIDPKAAKKLLQAAEHGEKFLELVDAR